MDTMPPGQLSYIAQTTNGFFGKPSFDKPQDVREIIYDPVTFPTFTTYEMNQEEVNGFYATIQVPSDNPYTGPRGFLTLYDKMMVRLRGNTPANWYTWMIANRFLERCQVEFQGQEGWEAWYQTVKVPRAGVFNTIPPTENRLKALLEDQMKEQELPRKKRPQKIVVRTPVSHLSSSLVMEQEEDAMDIQ